MAPTTGFTLSMTARPFALALPLLAGALGCVHAPRVMSASRDPYVFWPPPPPTSAWAPRTPAGAATMGEAAAALAVMLRDAGYVDVRWYPIGGQYEHGFAVTTRLERLGAPTQRWPALYPEPVELRWLERASEPALPAVGFYRAFLVAFTDLPGTPGSGRAPRWDDTTVMETGNPCGPLPTDRVTPPGFRVLAFAYAYVRDGAESRAGHRAAESAGVTWRGGIGERL